MTGSPSLLKLRWLTLGALPALALIGSVLQVFIDASSANLAATCWVFASTMGIVLYIACTNAIKDQPLSTFSILGFCVTTQFGALIAQTAAWTPLRASLYDAVLTFSTLAIYQGIAIAVHATYRFFHLEKPIEERSLRRYLTRAGLYEVPRAGTLWIMGALGLICFILASRQTIDGKIANGFAFLAWAPFLIPIYRLQIGPSYCKAASAIAPVAVYALIIVIVGLGLNYRQQMFYGIVAIALTFLLVSLRSDSGVTWGSVAKFLIATAVGIAIAGPVSDLATAMAVARAHRGKISPVEMIATTLDVWGRPYLLAAYRADEKAQLSVSRYDESYIANPLLARFVETKFHDNALHFAAQLNSKDIDDLARFTRDSLWAVLPQPALDFLGFNISKVDFPETIGDYLAYLATGAPLRTNKTGSAFAQGRALFGVATFPCIYALICWAIFALMDLLTIRSSSATAYVCAIGLMKMWELFIYGITGEGLEAILALFGREVPQMILLYCLILAICRVMLPERTYPENGVDRNVG